MTKLLKYTLLIFLLSFAACSSEDDGAPSVPNGQPQPGDALEVTVSAADFVTDGAPDTRATDNGKTTTFDNGDRVGIIILDAGNNLIYDNIPYKYDNSKWTFDSKNSEGKGGCYYDPESTTYIVYYPYSQAADGVTSVDDLKAKFAPKFNQSDIKDYRVSDLMVWISNIHLTSSEKVLDAVLEHAFTSLSLTPTAYRLDDGNGTKGNIKVSDVSLTIGDNVYVPYQEASGSLRCIVPADITPGDIRCFYTFNGTTYGNTINISGKVAANTRYTSAPEIISKTYTLDDAKVGDFYCKRSSDNNGYLIPSDVALTDGQKNDCVGIVCWVGSKAYDDDPLLNIYHSNCLHGLVVALQDAGTVRWIDDEWKYVQNWVEKHYNSSVNIQETNKMCGYSNTLALVAFNAANASPHVLPCDAIQEYSKRKPAPANSSGWYCPSVMELQYVCWGQGQEQGIIGRNYLNAQIGKVSGGNQIGIDRYHNSYWSSTEYGYKYYIAWYVNFGSGRVGYSDPKYSDAFPVRPLLAF